MVAVPVVNRYRPEASPVVGEPRVQRNLLVLLADEDDVARSAGEKLLNSLGYDVIHAWSAGGAIERMRDIQAIKVAIVDWMLPGGVDKVVRVALIRARRHRSKSSAFFGVLTPKIEGHFWSFFNVFSREHLPFKCLKGLSQSVKFLVLLRTSQAFNQRPADL